MHLQTRLLQGDETTIVLTVNDFLVQMQRKAVIKLTA